MISLHTQNERLKREASQERSMYASQMSMEGQEKGRNYLELQTKIDDLKDENITLKLRVSELESEILDEKNQKQMKYDLTLDTLKSQVQEQYLEQKVRFEEEIMVQKEQNYKYKVEIQGLNERNSILKDQLLVFRDRITELEKETIIQSKENYILNSELDYESTKNNQLKLKTESMLSGMQTGKVVDTQVKDRIIQEYERKIASVEQKLLAY